MEDVVMTEKERNRIYIEDCKKTLSWKDTKFDKVNICLEVIDNGGGM